MALGWYAFALLLHTTHLVSSSGPDEVPFTPITDAVEKRAVCMDGSRAGYHFASGSGDGARSWLVFMKGGAWCPNYNDCQNKTTKEVGTTRNLMADNFTGILSKSQDINPDFYNWNKIYVHYCDQASFLGDTEIVDQGQNLQFRGSRIFDVVIEDLLAKGMNDAENAILAGRSAGGLATILHCDGFRARLPNVGRVKCFSDAGFFIRAKDLPYAEFRENVFASTITFHNISSFLPTSCTRRIDQSLCLFPEYLVGDVQTPLFILNSAFDYYQIEVNLVPKESPKWPRWKKCLGDLQHCKATDIDLIKDFGVAFLNAIRGIPNNPTRGVYIHPCFAHTVSFYYKNANLWNPNSTYRLGNLTLPEAVGNWYFDRSSVNLVRNLLVPQESPNWERWDKCLFDLSKCPAAIGLIKEFGGKFLEEIRAIDDNPSRGFFIHPCFTHTVSMYPADKLWTPNSSLTLGNNVSMVQAVGDWYFDRASVRLITSAVSPESCK